MRRGAVSTGFRPICHREFVPCRSHAWKYWFIYGVNIVLFLGVELGQRNGMSSSRSPRSSTAETGCRSSTRCCAQMTWTAGRSARSPGRLAPAGRPSVPRRRAFRAQGIPGLLPRPRGPKRAHKCTDEILDFAAQWRAAEPPDAESVTDAIRRRFGVSIHPRSLQRALARRAKKGRQKGAGRA
jgi:hypothetical protein